MSSLGDLLSFIARNPAMWITVTSLVVVALCAFVLYRESFGSSSSGNGLDISGVGDLEVTLKKVLEQTKGATGAEGTGGTVSPEELQAAKEEAKAAVAAELEKLKADVEAKAAEIEAMKSGGSAEGSAAEVDTEILNKVKDLEARLAEYEIIEDDIADLSIYKEENQKLKEEIEALKSGGAAVTPEAEKEAEAEAEAGTDEAAEPVAEGDSLDIVQVGDVAAEPKEDLVDAFEEAVKAEDTDREGSSDADEAEALTQAAVNEAMREIVGGDTAAPVAEAEAEAETVAEPEPVSEAVAEPEAVSEEAAEPEADSVTSEVDSEPESAVEPEPDLDAVVEPKVAAEEELVTPEANAEVAPSVDSEANSEAVVEPEETVAAKPSEPSVESEPLAESTPEPATIEESEAEKEMLAQASAESQSEEEAPEPGDDILAEFVAADVDDPENFLTDDMVSELSAAVTDSLEEEGSEVAVEPPSAMMKEEPKAEAEISAGPESIEPALDTAATPAVEVVAETSPPETADGKKEEPSATAEPELELPTDIDTEKMMAEMGTLAEAAENSDGDTSIEDDMDVDKMAAEAAALVGE